MFCTTGEENVFIVEYFLINMFTGGMSFQHHSGHSNLNRMVIASVVGTLNDPSYGTLLTAVCLKEMVGVSL